MKCTQCGKAEATSFPKTGAVCGSCAKKPPPEKKKKGR